MAQKRRRSTQKVPHRELELLSASVHTLFADCGVPIVLGAYVHPQGESLTIIAAEGLRSTALIGHTIRANEGLGGSVLTSRRSRGVANYGQSQTITHEHDALFHEEGINSLAAVPVIVLRQVRAILYAGSHTAMPLPGRLLDELREEGRCLEQRLAVMDAQKAEEDEQQFRSILDDPFPHQVAATEQTRRVYQRLRLIASDIEDPALRREIEDSAKLLVRTPPVRRSLKELSSREIDILSCIAIGHTTRQAAEEMGIGLETAKSYIASCRRKLHVHSRYEAVSVARSLGFIP